MTDLALRRHSHVAVTPTVHEHAGRLLDAMLYRDLWNLEPSRYHNLSPNIREAVLAAEREALAQERGFRRFRAHDLRHTFAIRWLQKGGKLWPLSFHLGHTNIKTTEYYVQWLREHPRG